MPPLLPRRRPIESHKVTQHPILSTPAPQKSGFFSISPTFILLLFLTIWSISSILSSSFHICVSSRKLDLYCISGGLNRHEAASIHSAPSSKLTNDTEVILDRHLADKPDDEIVNAVKVVQENLQVIRSWADTSNNTSPSCDGRGIFVYDLPPKFNKELLSHCNNLLPWTDLCDYFENDGMGNPIPQLGKGWYRTHQYSLELIFHSRILNHPCRVTNPDDAKLFYVPFYGGLDILRWHFNNASVHVKDALGRELVRWLEEQRPWARNGGKDHMFVLGKISWDFRRSSDSSWGSDFLLLDQMRAPYKFMIERQPWELNDIGIPHPTHFHPHTDDDIVEWQRRIDSARRKNLVSFAGAARPGSADSIRSALIKNCVESGGVCSFLDCGSGKCASPEEVITAFTEAEFCLQPPGDSPTRKSVFDGLIAGCIPVLFDPFTAYYQYPWHLPEDRRKFSVFIDKEKVRKGKVDVIERLKSITLEERREMRRYIIYELMPGLVYGDSSSKFFRFRDAFGVVMDNVMSLVTKSSE